VEFYFENDGFQNLNEIVIKLWNFDSKYKSEYFELDWLKTDLSYSRVIEIMKKGNWQFELVKRPIFKSQIILPCGNVICGFDSDEEDGEYLTELQKIYIRKNNYDIKLLNK
jgi:hypothetical protein